MKTIINKFKNLKLFTQMFMVMVVSIIVVSVVVSWTTIHMSRDLFMKTFSITNTKVIDQIKTSFESFNDSIATVVSNANQSGTIKSFLTEGDGNSLSTMRSYYNTSEQMKRLKSNMDAYEVAITIVGVNGRMYSTDRSYLLMDDKELKQHSLTINSHKEPKRIIYQPYTELEAINSENEHLIVASKALLDRSTGNIYGTIYIAIKERDFGQFFNSYTSSGNDVFIINHAGVIVSSNRSDRMGQESKEMLKYAMQLQEESTDYLNGSVMGKQSLLLSEYLPPYEFYIVNTIDTEMALGQMVDVKTLTLICIVIVCIALSLVFLITRQITKSLTKFVRQMSDVTNNEFDHHITVTGGSEIRELGHAFNYMLDELHDYVDRLVETQKGQRNAELAALQRQINPHFLYNTLASIKVLVQQGSKEKATETIHSLISVLQNTISNVSETITVEQELEILKHYVFINHARYGDRIKVSYFVASECMDYHVPKLIIQPFIENAFFHAFNKKSSGYIHVLVSRDREHLYCEVVDSGDGIEGVTFSDDNLFNSKRSSQLFTGIGIKNVHERIELLYGDEYGVSIVSKLGEGTRMKIKLPLVKKQR
ncbi:sensor histidine kinase YesM [Paenibacillus sp. DS2015]|uniref:sensor histidine kinase n=1 Tax=Paenibacillus sp. DS2015 TaxID=3373917 RepID=UPI003D223576